MQRGLSLPPDAPKASHADGSISRRAFLAAPDGFAAQTASLNVVTFLPEARLRISGSRVRRPVRRTMFIGPISFPGKDYVAPS